MFYYDIEQYRNINVIESDCMLVSATNAYFYIYGEYITDEKYREIAKEIGGYYGPVINIEKMFDLLDLKYKYLYDFKENICKQIMPVEVSIKDKNYGLHSALIIDYNREVEAVQVTGLKLLTNRNGWMFLDDLYLILQDFDTECKTPFRQIMGNKE